VARITARAVISTSCPPRRADHAADAPGGVLQQAAKPGAGADRDVRGGEDGDGDRLHDRPAGLVAADPGHAGLAVRGLQALDKGAVGRAVEGRAEVGEAAHSGRAFLGHQPGHGRVDQAGAGGHGVGGV
jgi:hypothetical protein